jgi:hypothetical protein
LFIEDVALLLLLLSTLLIVVDVDCTSIECDSAAPSADTSDDALEATLFAQTEYGSPRELKSKSQA